MRKLAIVFSLVWVALFAGCSQEYRASLSPDMQAIELSDDMVLGLHLFGDGWTVSKEPTAGLIEETAEHLEHEVKEKGQTATSAQLTEMARKRLQINEAFVVNRSSGAHLDVDISRIGEGESAPSSSALKNSARYAASSLESEEGVSDLTSRVEKVTLPGTRVAYRLSAEYKLHEEPRRFIGVVTFVSPYWVYLYYTDTLKNDSDYKDMEQMLQSAVLVSRRAP